MLKYQVKLAGPSARGGRVSATVLRQVLRVLLEGCRGALRLRLDGRSTVPGPAPSWLGPASQFDLVGLSEGSTVLELEAPPLSEAVPDTFAQRDLFVDVSRSCLSFFSESCQEALDACVDGEFYDERLLKTFEGFSGILASGFESIEMVNGGRRERERLSIRSEGIQTIKRLQRQTPASRRSRVSGILDQIRHSDRMFSLLLDGGTAVKGVATRVDPDSLKDLWGGTVVVSGTAVFRPSGALRRIDADHIEAAQGDVSLWSVEPKPLQRPNEPVSRHRRQGPRSGINAIIGQWPGDETDEEIVGALEELS